MEKEWLVRGHAPLRGPLDSRSDFSPPSATDVMTLSLNLLKNPNTIVTKAIMNCVRAEISPPSPLNMSSQF